VAADKQADEDLFNHLILPNDDVVDLAYDSFLHLMKACDAIFDFARFHGLKG
jgi:hypothetical protein